MTFERDSRVSRSEFPLWRMEIGTRDERSTRRLIIEPYAMRQSSYPPELRMWLEEDTPQYCYIVESPTAKPTGAPSRRVESVPIENSRRTVPAKTGLEYVVIEALAMQQLIGDSAKSALHNLFWTSCVIDDDGLTWLCKYTSKETGNFYAGQRLVEYTRSHDIDKRDSYKARCAVEDVMKHDRELGERMQQRVMEDEAFQHAVEALLLTNEDQETKNANVRRIVELNATDKDRVFASIVAASRGVYDLRGLRACQRAERDPEFFEAIASIARRIPIPAVRAKHINAFLHKSRPNRDVQKHDVHLPRQEKS
jgi:hypothetical protein